MADYDNIFHDFASGNITPFYDMMYPGMMLYAMHILGDEFAYMAEDCVQESVITAYMKREEFKSGSTWRAFLLTCIRNNAIAILRKSSRHLTYIEKSEKADIQDDCSYALIEHEIHEMLFDAIESLPEKFRKIFELSFEAGLKNAEIAKILGIAEITVKKRKAALITHLHNRLGGIFDEKSILLLISTHIANIAG
ncbi:RNA polymerase sigma factor [uncultured Duncaniella sp.]|uniref:RNA polymerase sigma factor n=2 Tax=uncultured Duncaniella sp. TaxID=2768039 RepID=UPI002670262E|nr:sigma-70 family RNA polymerase sigma factor [uncultured Duncaniella sp.]